MIRAKVIEDSISPTGERLTTIEVELHRFVLAELNTHRQFSRNSASSRAIPLKRSNLNGSLDKVRLDPAWPKVWPCEKPGMSGGVDLIGRDLDSARLLFMKVWNNTIEEIELYLLEMKEKYGDESPSHTLHKSLINRLIEPFMWHKVVITSSEWQNFFDQRCHPDAQPEMRLAAEAIYKAYKESVPKKLKYGQFHLPYITDEERLNLGFKEAIRCSVARCARVSYDNFDGTRDVVKDVNLFVKLDGQNPPHLSPMEHVATPAKPKKWYTPWRKKPLGNFNGWEQVRHNRSFAR